MAKRKLAVIPGAHLGRGYWEGLGGSIWFYGFRIVDTLENHIRAGFITADTRLPKRPRGSVSSGSCMDCTSVQVSMLVDGRLTVTLDAEVAARRDMAFQNFMCAAMTQ